MVTDNLTPPRRPWGTYALGLLWAVIGTSALLLLAKSVQHSSDFGRLQPWILLLNLIGVIGLTVLIARKIWQLVSDYRANVPGSRLTARTVSTFGALVIAPLLIVYLFSLDFLNRGIDSWFRIEIKQGLNDALLLSRSAIDVRMREYGRRTEDFAAALVNAPRDQQLLRLNAELRATDASEIALFDSDQHVLAFSSDNFKRGGAGPAPERCAAADQPASPICRPRPAGRRPVPDPGRRAAVGDPRFERPALRLCRIRGAAAAGQALRGGAADVFAVR